MVDIDRVAGSQTDPHDAVQTLLNAGVKAADIHTGLWRVRPSALSSRTPASTSGSRIWRHASRGLTGRVRPQPRRQTVRTLDRAVTDYIDNARIAALEVGSRSKRLATKDR